MKKGRKKCRYCGGTVLRRGIFKHVKKCKLKHPRPSHIASDLLSSRDFVFGRHPDYKPTLLGVPPAEDKEPYFVQGGLSSLGKRRP
jgi:hypothetical protein